MSRLLFAFLAMIGFLLLGGCEPKGAAVKAQGGASLSAIVSYPAFVVADDAPNALATVPLPDVRQELIGQSLLLFHSDRWEVRRSYPSGYVEVYFRADGAKTHEILPLPLEWRRNTHPINVLTGDTGDIFVVGYDVVANTASGRRLESVRSGIDIYHFAVGNPASPERIADSLPIGGIDTLTYGEFSRGVVHLCGTNRCFSIAGNNKTEWKLEFAKGYEFVELVFKGDRAAALLRKPHDDRVHGFLDTEAARYFVAVLDANGGVVKPLAAGGVPWAIEWRNQTPAYRLAKSKQDFLDIFYFDWNRMPFQGVMDLGSNNLEGRIAWSQHYYLNALLSILSRQVPHISPSNTDSVARRVAVEVQMIADLSLDDYPGYRVKRYSIDREPVLFALHLGRIAALLARTQSVEAEVTANRAIAMLRSEMQRLHVTVEASKEVPLPANGFSYLAYRVGSPFWADGATVPYNYASGLVDGLLAVTTSKPAVQWAEALMQPLLRLEFGERKPDSWRYWWGVGDDGWDRKHAISLNTPVYAGNKKALAHITYRTMDAKALVALYRRQVRSVDTALVSHLRELTAKGRLLPYLNEDFVSLGGRVVLDPHVARRYARSTTGWELQAQVWALDQLAKQAGQ